MNRRIDLEERKKIQLGMLQEIHEFCKTHGIRYSLSCGTLIGAIRHKGFIPWDDDVDLMMPLPDMLRLKKELNSNSLKYIDVSVRSDYDMPFPRIAYMPTYMKQGLAVKTYGVNIDIYPITSLPDSKAEQDSFFEKAKALMENRMRYIYWRNTLIKYLPITTIPGFKHAITRYQDYILFNGIEYGSTNYYYVHSGPIQNRQIRTFNKDLFDTIIEVQFEKLYLNSIGCYDYYLTQLYGDYMQLPPENQRHPYHGGEFFWK